MNIQYLNYFLRLAKTRNITAAAADLNMSSQGLMKAVSRMEEEMGCRLFERTAHGLEITPEGTWFSAYAHSMLDEYEQCRSLLSDRSFNLNHFNITAAVGTLAEYAARAIRDFKKLHPEYTVTVHELSQKECEDAVASGSALLGFGIEPFPQGLEVLPVHALFPAILLRRDHPLANEPVITREMIAGLPMVLLNRQFASAGAFLDSMERSGTAPRVQARAHSILEMAKLVMTESLAGLVNVSLAADIENRELAAVPLAAPGQIRNLCVFRKAGRIPAKAPEEFFEFCRSVPLSRKLVPLKPEDLL